MRTMYDAVTPSNIPTTAQIVAGYIDGMYAWKAADWARFPNSVHVPIAVFPSTNAGIVLDVEKGDATPAQAPGWVVKRRAAGVNPSVYCSLALWPAVRAAFAAAGVPEPHYWIAAYPGNGAALYAGSVAHQYADPGPYDVSVVADYWPGVDTASGGLGGVGSGTVNIPAPPTFPTPAPAPTPAPTASTQEEDDMIRWTNRGSVWVASVATGAFWGVPGDDTDPILLNKGIVRDLGAINDREHDQIKASCARTLAAIKAGI